MMNSDFFAAIEQSAQIKMVGILSEAILAVGRQVDIDSFIERANTAMCKSGTSVRFCYLPYVHKIEAVIVGS